MSNMTVIEMEIYDVPLRTRAINVVTVAPSAPLLLPEPKAAILALLVIMLCQHIPSVLVLSVYPARRLAHPSRRCRT